MRILNSSKDLLEYIQSRSLTSCNNIKLHVFDFSTLYTIPHSKLKDRLRDFFQLCFIKKNGQGRYKYHVLGRDISCFANKPFWFYQDVPWNWHHQNAGVFEWQHICYIWWTCFSTHTHKYKLCSSSRRLIHLFVWNRLHTWATQENRKKLPDPLISRSATVYKWCPFTKWF